MQEMRLWTLDVGTMTGKAIELANKTQMRKVDILCVKETQWKGSRGISLGAGFQLFCQGVDGMPNGVGAILKYEFTRNVLEVKTVSE